MQKETNKSEVARICQQIRKEYEAATQGLTGFRQTGRHAFVTARMENMSKLHTALHDLVGDESMALLTECLETLPETSSIATMEGTGQ